jgi:hypothetical protein
MKICAWRKIVPYVAKELWRVFAFLVLDFCFTFHPLLVTVFIQYSDQVEKNMLDSLIFFSENFADRGRFRLLALMFKKLNPNPQHCVQLKHSDKSL